MAIESHDEHAVDGDEKPVAGRSRTPSVVTTLDSPLANHPGRKPLRNAVYEKFSRLCAQGLNGQPLNHSDAYREAYPNSVNWKNQRAVHVKAYELSIICGDRISYLQAREAEAGIIDAIRRKRILSRIAVEIGEMDPADYVEAGGDGVYITFGKESPRRLAIAGMESRTEMAAEGSGKNDAVVTKIRFRDLGDAIAAIKELNAMDGVYPKAAGPDSGDRLILIFEGDRKRKPRRMKVAVLDGNRRVGNAS